MAIETNILQHAVATQSLANKKTLRRVLVGASLGTFVTIVVSAIWIRETKDHKLDV